MGVARVLNYSPDNQTNFPVYGGSADIKIGAFLRPGVTADTDLGALIKASSYSAALPDVVGILQELHDYSVTGDTLQAGTYFVTHPIDLVFPYRVVRMEYDLTSVITCTQAVSTTTMTVTSLEDNIDASFLYVVAGTGLGQTNFLTASAAGSATLKAAFGTSLSTDSTFIKILRRFHRLVGLNSDGTKLSSQAAAGSVTWMIMDSYIIRDGDEKQLNPVNHAALTGLNGLASLHFEADVAIVDSVANSLD